jgi:acyl-CoA thioester hydrolase
VAYFKYIQASRVNYWEVSGLSSSFATTKTGPILLSTSCLFIKPLHYPGNIVAEASVEFIKNTSFGIHHRIFNEQDELVAEAQDVIVTYDFNNNVKVKVPDEFRKSVEIIEGKKL